MSRYLGPRLRIIRRLGKLRGLTRKKPFRRIFKGKGSARGKVLPPGQHGLSKMFQNRSSDSNYLIRLKVKQRLRMNYGLSERQLVRYVRKAKTDKESTGQALLSLLEMRLDNVIFRLNMAPTIAAARQLIGHGHIKVNNKRVNIPSYMCKPKDVLSVLMKPQSLKLVNRNLQDYYNRISFYKKRLEKTLAFSLFKAKIAKDMTEALQLVVSGQVKINRKKVTIPNYVCTPRDIIFITLKQGIRKITGRELLS
uniref:Small ribosomal subunit protein uS4c n=1 Tax=Johansenicoccus eremophilus TaxID=3068301 RepID=A0AA49LNE6_9CHLO|nr:ribosomal protein S4 [Chlorophyceae sp. KF-2023a]